LKPEFLIDLFNQRAVLHVKTLDDMKDFFQNKLVKEEASE